MKRLDQAIFGPTTPHTMALYRIVIGFLAFVNWAMLTPFFGDWYTETGYVSSASTERWQGPTLRFDPLTPLANDALNQVVWFALGAVFISLMLGWQTRLMAVLAFLGTVAFHHRNPFLLHSGDTLLRMSLFALAIAPCGLVWSLDARQRMGEVPMISMWHQRLVQIQLAVMYGTTVIHKGMGTMWRDGTASWYPTRLSEFERFPVPPFMDTPFMVAASTYSTILIEIALATLVFHPRFRGWVLLGGVALHGMIEWRMNIPLFAFISIAQYVSHYRGEEVNAFFERWWDLRRRSVPSPAP